MTFSDLYGERLSRELGSSDTTALFTTARRKAAINEAMRWFVTETGCLVSTGDVPMVDSVATYDLEAEIDDDAFFSLSRRRAPVFKADPGGGGAIVYYTGKLFQRRSIQWLDRYEPGWRSADPGLPQCWYEQLEGGQRLFGVYPSPDIPAGATWTLQIPYVVLPTAMSADGDEPFTVATNPQRSLEPWHDALPYYAASELEKLRKGLERSAFLRQQAETRVLDYLDKQRVPGGKTIMVGRDYRRDARRRPGLSDFGNPWDDPMK